MRRILLLAVSAVLMLFPALAVYGEDETAEPSPSVINIVLPLSLDFTINPFELDGKGQIYSDIYRIENLSDTEVGLTFTEALVIFANDTDFEPLTAPFDEQSETDRKSIYLTVDFMHSDMEPIILTDTDCILPPITLNAGQQSGSVLNMQIGGSVNPYPAVKWRSGDVKIQLNYQIEAVAPKEEELLEPIEITTSEKTATPGNIN